LLTAFGILTIISNPHFICAAVGFFIAGLGISCLVPIIYSLAGKQKGVNPGMGIAMVNTVSSTAFLFGPFLIGAIADATSMRVAYGYVFGLTLIMTFLTYRLMNHK
jgi:MFS family permease